MHKYLLLLFSLLFINITFAQDDELAAEVEVLSKQIRQARESEKLQLLESLCKLTKYYPEYKYDSIVRATINYAIQVDSINKAGKQIAYLIYYQTNILHNPDVGIKAFQEHENTIQRINKPSILARIYTNLGDSYFFGGNIIESIPFYEQGENNALIANDSIFYAIIRTYKAAAFTESGKLAEASQMLLEAVRIFNNANDTKNLQDARNTLAILYSKMGFYEEAKKEREDVIRIAREQKRYDMLIVNLSNQALDENSQNNQASRIKYLIEAYEIAILPDNESGYAYASLIA